MNKWIATLRAALSPRALLARLRWPLAGLAVVWLLGWFALPPVLKWQIETQASRKLGRAVSVERVDFAPWSLELAVVNLRIASREGGAPQLGIARMVADLELQSLLRWAPVVDALRIERPTVRLRHLGEGRYDIDDVIARLRESPDDGEGLPRFSLFNIHLDGGELDFVDQPAGATHQVRAFKLDIPFLSNIGSRREVMTRPHLAFQLNGADVTFDAAATPFAEHRRGELEMEVPRLDLAPWLAYWPARLPLRPRAGRLSARMKISFEQQDAPRVVLSGGLALEEFEWLDATARPVGSVLAFRKFSVDLGRSRPLEKMLAFDRIALEGPQLTISRDAASVNLVRIATGFAAASPATISEKPAAAWKIRVNEARIDGARIDWQDAVTRPASRLALEDVSAKLVGLDLPLKKSAPFELAARLEGARIGLSGQVQPEGGQVRVELAGLPLGVARPYLKAVLNPDLNGTLNAQAEVLVSGQAVSVREGRLEVADFKLGSDKAQEVAWKALQLENIRVDLAERAVLIGATRLIEPQVAVKRNAAARWMFEDWRVVQPPAAQPATARLPWRLELDELTLEQGAVNLLDEKTARPVRAAMAGLNLRMSKLAPLAMDQAMMPVSLKFGLRHARARAGDGGRFEYTGQLRLPGVKPLSTRGQLHIERLPLHVFEPYLAEVLNLELVRADLSYRGRVEAALPAAGPDLNVAGQLAVEDLRANTLTPSEELLDWKGLNLRGLELVLAAGQLQKLRVNETVLNDYFARVILDANGRLNLQGLLRASPAQPAASPPARPDIRFGPITLAGGRVSYSDRFVKPNYSAQISELTGSLGSFSNAVSDPPQIADLALRGRVEGTATLDISGKLNPLAQPVALDVTGRVRELELPPLSPYSAKYAGYGIERGKLSLDVAYRITPDGNLQASNQVVLNQLTFGEHSGASDAPNLPVKLAVALLADRDGVIDINLPISGSINDPDFSLGPIILKVIFNLVGKAITSPFSLLAGAFQGEDEKGAVEFALGSAVMTAAGVARLDAIGEALKRRPALKLTIIGEAALEVEKEGYRRARLRQMVAAEKRRQQARAGGALDGETVVTDVEYPALLKAVFRRADIAKPRNLVGLAKDIPQGEMESLLMSSIAVTDDAMRELALARAVAVKDRLIARSLPAERLFLGAVQLNSGQIGWVPRAGLKLGVR